MPPSWTSPFTPVSGVLRELFCPVATNVVFVA
jgi:hypothetical protein